MKVIELTDWSGLDALKIADRPEPEPGPGEVVVAMKAASLNYRDLLQLKGGYGSVGGGLPIVPLSDGAGEVVALGDGVTRFGLGDRVCPTFFQGWAAGPRSETNQGTALGGPIDGTLQEKMVVPEQWLVKMADHLSFPGGASLPCAALTAWSCVVKYAQVKAGDTVVVQGTGGVALFALQFAKANGAEVVITSSSDEKLEKAKALGADHVINYKSEPKWGKEVRNLLGRGADVVVELGGGDTLEQSLRAVRPGGMLGMIGVLGGAKAQLTVPFVVMYDVRLQGVTVGSREDFIHMMRAIAQNQVEPVVDSVFPFEAYRDAIEHMSAGKHFGKVCIAHPGA